MRTSAPVPCTSTLWVGRAARMAINITNSTAGEINRKCFLIDGCGPCKVFQRQFQSILNVLASNLKHFSRILCQIQETHYYMSIIENWKNVSLKMDQLYHLISHGPRILKWTMVQRIRGIFVIFGTIWTAWPMATSHSQNNLDNLVAKIKNIHQRARNWIPDY